MRKLFIIPILAASINIAYGGVNGLTFHSRANCVGFNESISWYLGHSPMLSTQSYHYYGENNLVHILTDPLRPTWRSAAYDFGKEGLAGGWAVRGIHWIVDPFTQLPKVARVTEAVDCYIYDGWWDYGN